MTAVTIEIGSLELVGFPAARRFAIAEAFEHALGRIVRERGLPAPRAIESPGSAGARSVAEGRRGEAIATARDDRRVAPPLRLDPEGPASVIGEAIAHAVYEGLR